MEVKNWEHIESLFHAALRLETAERAAHLDRICEGDESLRAEVESLLVAFEKQRDFMEESAYGLGMRVLSGETTKSLAGKLIGPYKILELLGKGGMGEA